MRLFAALRPPFPVLEHLRTALLAVTGHGDAVVRWTAEENWHLTLAFYGTVPGGAVPDLQAGVDGAASSSTPLELRLRGAGEFAHRTLWVGATGDLDALGGLSRELVAVGADHLGRRDDRVRSRPHLTVGRVPPAARARAPRRHRSGRAGRAGRAEHSGGIGQADLDALVRSLAVYEGPPWQAEEVLLVESRPGEGRGGGPLYTDVSRHPLGGHH